MRISIKMGNSAIRGRTEPHDRHHDAPLVVYGVYTLLYSAGSQFSTKYSKLVKLCRQLNNKPDIQLSRGLR